MRRHYSLFLFFVIVFFSLIADAGQARRAFKSKNMRPKKMTQQNSLITPAETYEGYDTCKIYKEPIEVELITDLGTPK